MAQRVGGGIALLFHDRGTRRGVSGQQHALAGWKSMDSYDTCARVFVALFNGFMSLTSYFDVMYRY